MKDLKTIESLRQRLFDIRTRAREMDANAVTYRKSPYAASPVTVLFAQAVAKQVLSFVSTACEHIAVLENSLHEPISEFHDIYLTVRYERESESTGVNVDAIAQANVAIATHLVKLGYDQLNHAQSCLEGEVTLEGQRITRGPLWEK